MKRKKTKTKISPVPVPVPEPTVADVASSLGLITESECAAMLRMNIRQLRNLRYAATTPGGTVRPG